MPRPNIWTENQDNILREHWRSDTTLIKLCEMLRKAKKTIFARAKELNLPEREKCKTGKGKHVKPETYIQFEEFLERYKDCKVVEHAAEGVMSVKTIRHLCRLKPEYKKRFLDVRMKIYSSVQCKYCSKIFTTKKLRVKNNVCKECASDNRDNTKFTLEGKLRSMCMNAKARNSEYNISVPYLVQLYKDQKGKCHYSGIKMELPNENNFTGDNLISLDRKNSDSGYLIGNVVLCCWKINRMKNDISYADFPKICEKIVNTMEYSQTEYY